MAEGLIGIVTVTYNSASVLPDFLRCLAAQTHTNFLAVAVDNASRDNTLEILYGYPDNRLTVIANPDNRGVAEGNNQGIRHALNAGCGTVLLLNNDTEFSDTLVEELAAGLETYGCDMICPKIMFFDQPDRIWAAGGYFQPRLGYRALHYGVGEIDHGQFDRSRKVTYTATCCVLIRAQVFSKIGIMDPRYFVYADDTDFMYRALKAGATLFYLATAKVLHKDGSLTGGQSSPFTVRYASRNLAYFQLKHLRRGPAMFWIMLRWVHYLLRVLRSQDDLKTLRLRQKAIVEAWRMV